MKETGRIKLKEIPFSRAFETGNGFQDREGNLYYGN